VKGAFTGASRNKRGYFELANKGTLFLDEIGNLQPDIQVKLLRAIQEKVVMRMGSEKSLHIDVRIIVAANEDLREKVNKGSFREDLFHRINAFRLYLPSLRDRMEDIDIFINHFISKANKEFDKQIEGITAEFKEIIHKYSWPGNIRELENIIRRCVLLESGRLLTASTLPDEIVFQIEENIDSGDQLNSSHGHELKNAVNFAEKEAILEALRRSDNNKTAAARMLKIDRKTLYNKLKKYDLNI
jgi:two-component system response regulator HydG